MNPILIGIAIIYIQTLLICLFLMFFEEDGVTPLFFTMLFAPLIPFSMAFILLLLLSSGVSSDVMAFGAGFAIFAASIVFAFLVNFVLTPVLYFKISKSLKPKYDETNRHQEHNKTVK